LIVNAKWELIGLTKIGY